MSKLDLKLEKIYSGYSDRKVGQWAGNFQPEYFNPSRADDWQIPIMDPIDIVPTGVYGFHKTKSARQYGTNIDGKAVHFFEYDYHFERVWNEIDTYTEFLRPYDCVFTPDFSLYENFALPIWWFQTFRNRLIGQVWQDEGLPVVPTANWGGEDTFDIVFRGIPKHSTIAFSTMGWKTKTGVMPEYQQGIRYMCENLEPIRFLIYGNVLPDIDYNNVECLYYENDSVVEMKDRCNRKEIVKTDKKEHEQFVFF